jgi:hypothetical protein
MKTLNDVIEALKAGAVIEKVWNDNWEEPEFYVNDVLVTDAETDVILRVAFYKDNAALRVEELDYPTSLLILA